MLRLSLVGCALLFWGCTETPASEPVADAGAAEVSSTDSSRQVDVGPDSGPGLACGEGFDSGLSNPFISFEAVEDGRYCEVLIVRLQEDGSPLADVYNSLVNGGCPQELWEALDADVIKEDFPDAMMVYLNGPRYFLMQDLFDAPSGTGPMELHDFGGIQMAKMATVAPSMGMIAAQSGYEPVTVDRDNTWRFRAGTRVHELIDGGGDVYVMQSFSRLVDEDLSFDDLETLGERLDLPEGWSYRVRLLDSDLDVQADGTATVVQDELRNTYQWRSDCQVSQ